MEVSLAEPVYGGGVSMLPQGHKNTRHNCRWNTAWQLVPSSPMYTHTRVLPDFLETSLSVPLSLKSKMVRNNTL